MTRRRTSAPACPRPCPTPDGLDAPFWEGLRAEQLLLQRCNGCDGWQWGPEWCCHRCHSFDLRYEETPAEGVIYSHERVWHPVHPALAEQGPYVVVLVELPQADGVRIVGNLLGDPAAAARRSARRSSACFEHHDDADPPHTLLQWAVG